MKYSSATVNNTYDNKIVCSGRLNAINGDEDYKEVYEVNGASRHFTIIFNTFVML